MVQRLLPSKLAGEEAPQQAADPVNTDLSYTPDAAIRPKTTSIQPKAEGTEPQPLSDGGAAGEGLGPAKSSGEPAQLL
jgi:hypothetical protein